MYTEQLMSLGLNSKEAKTYEALLSLGASTITPIFQLSKLKKGDTYNVLRSLKEKELIKEKTVRGKTVFQAEPPQKISELLRHKQRQLDAEKNQLDTLLPELTTLFQGTTEKPIIQVLSGYDGIQAFYDDILTAETEILIFTSKYSHDDPKHEAILKKTLKQRFKKCKTRMAINTSKPDMTKKQLQEYLKLRESTNVEVRFIPDKFAFPSRITVYDNKVGITSLKKELITTLIENKNIADTFRQMFKYMWEKAEEDHNELINK